MARDELNLAAKRTAFREIRTNWSHCQGLRRSPEGAPGGHCRRH
uniref:RH63245p n=1 Tax=Drosophila melanogaster TaxID=7227 RepID=Q6AWR1_DROME|nr:RH63245p [Drosophila melanogaster]